MDNNPIVETTLKASALICLVESGVIQREENGDVDTERFEVFWERFSKNMETSMANTIGYYLEDLEKFYLKSRRKPLREKLKKLRNAANGRADKGSQQD